MKNAMQILLTLWLVAMAILSHAAQESITYIHTDHLGSPILATNQSGAVVWREDYQPHGTQLVQTDADNQVGFTGHLDEKTLGVTYMQGRWYHPGMGRFMALDPVGFVEGSPQSFNRYAYANNNPYRFVDPDGRWVEDVLIGIPSIIVGADSFSQNVSTGNYGAAAVDAGGMVADVLASTIPGVPGGAGLGIKATREAAEKFTAQSGFKALPSAKTMDHHLLPRQFKKYFEDRGMNIDQHTVTLGEKTHLKGVHGNGLGSMPGGWNKKWQEYIDNNPNASAKEVYQQLGKMMDEFGLNDHRIHSYGQ